MPTVDVIIPAYNAAKYLPIALDSVEAQTFEDWRILLIDDGSTDNTTEVVRPYMQRLGPKLAYIQQPNRGLPAARNTAIRNSSAEFLALLDADDIWLPTRLEQSLKSFEGRSQVGLSYGYISRVGPDGKVIDTFAEPQKNGEGWIASSIYTRAVYLPCPTITFRRRCVDEVGTFDETLRATEDRDLWLRISQRYQVALVPHLIALYRTSPDSMTTDPERMLQAQLQFIEKHYGSKGCGWFARRQAMSGIYRQRAEAFALRGRVPTAFQSSLWALWYYPLGVNTLRTAGSLLMRLLGLRRPHR
ncbi:glycosyltransferase family 2 protein [Granulicella sp. dw_53]|uniref:glycosyltransferase family 2 protein n=1 Tax=Granulicella sp. dw_53 TaxID=2719792 RepID=UPI001BD65C49|nr:glycosyltransferase family 2 protein [Granulicella sp. dw_53]